MIKETDCIKSVEKLSGLVDVLDGQGALERDEVDEFDAVARDFSNLIEQSQWMKFMMKMRADFGTPCSIDNLNGDVDLNEEGLWFTCPLCEEPILAADYSYDEVKDCCPVCEGDYYED